MRIAILLLLAVATTASARPHRVVLLDFEGPAALARYGRDAVIEVLEEDCDVLSAHRKAAKTPRVDAIIGGEVEVTGKQRVLTVWILDARTKKKVDDFTVELQAHGISDAELRKLAKQLGVVRKWSRQDRERDDDDY